ncbi:MAG: metalloregulator ArsR/SmtB family transcription factor, partial [bacterium]
MTNDLRVLKAMADPTRLRLLAILDNEELSVNELVRVLGMGQSRISRHLALLKDAGLVTVRRDGTWSFYSIPETVGESGYMNSFRESSDYKSALAGDGPRIRQVIKDRADSSQQYFDKIAEDWDDIRSEYYGLQVRNRALAGLIPNDWTVADIGCGTGFLLLALAPLVKKAIGVDNSVEMIRVARRNAAQRNIKNIDFVQSDMDNIKIKDGSLDGLTASMVLHHAPDPVATIKEWARVLKPGGKVSIVELENHEHDWLRDEMADVWLGFDPKQISTIFRSAGFEKIKVEKVDDEC